MPNLSNLAGGKVPDYIEFAWVTAPNAATQGPLAANTIVTLSCTNLVHNTGNLSVTNPVNNSDFTIPSGTYYFEMLVPTTQDGNGGGQIILGLDSVAGTSVSFRQSTLNPGSGNIDAIMTGQFVITITSTFRTSLLTNVANVQVGNRSVGIGFTNDTAGWGKRTTIKLWKLK